MEIYNGEGYDLLNDDEENNKVLTDLPKVRLFEDENGVISLSNINLINVGNEEEALNYLFIGDTNRMICETPNNDTSSRSHCIFTIFIQSQKIGSDKVRRSKLNLVDLAGSERVSKSGVTGNVLKESKYINLSLHFLEQVIIELHNKSNHIPYRNSMITTILKDSLGGNCKTVMIATLSMDKKSMFESISTCRFAQRVALIKNVTSINEITDPQLLIKKLKLQIKHLKEELALAKGTKDGDSGVLDDEEKERCKEMVEYFVNNDDDNEDGNMLLNITDQRKIRHCFKQMRDIIIYTPSKSKDVQGAKKASKVKENENVDVKRYKMKIKELYETVQERDHEIDILVKMLKKHKIKVKDNSDVKKKSAEKINLVKKKEKKVVRKTKKGDKVGDSGLSAIAECGAVNEDEAVRRNDAFKGFMKQSKLHTVCVMFCDV